MKMPDGSLRVTTQACRSYVLVEKDGRLYTRSRVEGINFDIAIDIDIKLTPVEG